MHSNTLRFLFIISILSTIYCSNKVVSVGKKAQQDLADLVKSEDESTQTVQQNQTYQNPLGNSSNIPAQGNQIGASPSIGTNSFGSVGGTASSQFGNSSGATGNR
jgi:hypothetical protein